MIFDEKSDHRAIAESDPRMGSRGEPASLRMEILHALIEAAKTSSRDIDWFTFADKHQRRS